MNLARNRAAVIPGNAGGFAVQGGTVLTPGLPRRQRRSH